MLSYRHGFHAGNHADVLKHAVLAFALDYMARKPAPFLILDSHAGAGLYDLRSAEAEKTGEHRAGIARLLGAASPPELVRHYLQQVAAANPGGDLAAYPGSPALILALRRPGDRAAFHELHPTDHQRLRALTAGCRGVSVERADGLAALAAHTPPPEKRGLYLIDPSYEIKTDYAAVVAALARAWRKFPAGVYLLWYPAIDRPRVEAMERSLRAAGLRRVFRVELCMADDGTGRGMTGSGVFVVNPPFTLPEAAREGLAWLAERLDATGPVRAEWLVPE
jgi:23S rRNA (adenine2030-N6)-methyltransferase